MITWRVPVLFAVLCALTVGFTPRRGSPGGAM